MIRLFRGLKSKLINEGRLGNYLLYALGEILLVVAGILIALKINNMNDARKQRELEVHYLQNIKADLTLTNNLLDRSMAERAACITYAHKILEHCEGRPITNVDSLNDQCVAIYSWRQFHQSNNTFQELTNSGNLALLTNDSIKSLLLSLDSDYELLKSEEAHFRFDAEELLYGPLYELLDMNPMVDNFEWKISGGNAGKNSALSTKSYQRLLSDLKVKNGFVMTKLEFGIMNGMMAGIRNKSELLIHIIDRELKN